MGLRELSTLSEEHRKTECLARLETNLVFVVADMLESLMVECEEINRRCGYQMRNEEKRHYNAAMFNLKRFRGVTKILSSEDQESFGNDSDTALDLLYAAVARTGRDNLMMHRFLEYIMSFPDKLGMDNVRKGGDAFEAIKKSLANGEFINKKS